MSSSPPDIDTVLRPAEEADAAAIAQLCNRLSQALYSDADVGEDEVRRWFDMPTLQMWVAEVDGRVAGYVDVDRDDGGRFQIDARVEPSSWGRGLAPALLASAESWAGDQGGSGAVARAFTAAPNRDLIDALEQRGYRLIRHSFNMETELAREIPEPRWPDGIAIRTYDPVHDEVAVYEAVQDAFADHWDYHRAPIERFRFWTSERPGFDSELCWLAEDGGELAGASLNFWHWSGDRTIGWIGTLGVRRPWRRRGLALALLHHSFRDFKRRDAKRVSLGVDAENTTGAVRLYERAGMHQAKRFDSFERTLP
jgi:mycothiol synthase